MANQTSTTTYTTDTTGYDLANELMQHVEDHTEQWDMEETIDPIWFHKQWVCPYGCGTITNDNEKLIRHAVNSHNYKPRSSTPKKKCWCGVTCNTTQKYISHVVYAHASGTLEVERVHKAIIGPVAQNCQVPQRPHILRRIFLLKHGLNEHNFKIFKSMMEGKKRLRMYCKPPRTSQKYDLTFKFKETEFTLCFNTTENNAGIFGKLSATASDPKFEFIGRGQVRIELFGMGLGQMDCSDTLAEVEGIASSAWQKALDKGMSLLAVICFLKAMWAADNNTRGYMIAFVGLSYMRNSDNRQLFMRHSQNLLDWCFKPQAQVNHLPLASILSVACLLLFQAVPANKTLENVSKAFARSGHAAKGVMNTFDGFQKLVDWFGDAGSTEMFGWSLLSKESREIKKEIEEHYNRVVDLLQREQTQKREPDFIREVKTVYHQNNALISRFSQKFLPTTTLQNLNVMGIKITKLYERVVNGGYAKMGGRIEPVVICFSGASGIGKSHLAMQFAVKAIRFVDPDRKLPWPSQVFVRDSAHQYWDNYHEQPVVLYDDFGQLVDTQAKPNPEFLELIKSQNVTDWPLNMAALEDKSNTYFKSRVIILTTNLEKFHAMSLTCNEALQRRVEYNFKILPKEGPSYKVNKEVNPYDYDYKLVNGSDKIYTADQILEIMKKDLETKKVRFEEMLEKYGKFDDQTNFGGRVSQADFTSDTATFENHTKPVLNEPKPEFEDTSKEINVEETQAKLNTLSENLPGGQVMTFWDYVKWGGRVIKHTQQDEEFVVPCDRPQATAVYRFNNSCGGEEKWLVVGDKFGVAKDVWVRPLNEYKLGDSYCKPMDQTEFSMLDWIGMISLAFNILVMSFQVYKYFFDRKGHEGTVTHSHEGLERGKKVEHTHACEACNTQFKHTHTIRHPTVSRTYGPNLCAPCKERFSNLMESYVSTRISVKTHPQTIVNEKNLAYETDNVLAATNPKFEKVSPHGVPNLTPLVLEPNNTYLKTENSGSVKIESYSSGSTPKPDVKRVEAYSTTATPKPDTKRVESTSTNSDVKRMETYASNATPKPDVKKVQTMEEMNAIDIDKYIYEVAQRLANGEYDFTTPAWYNLSAENKRKVDNFLGTEHRTRLERHRELVYDVYDLHKDKFGSLAPDVLMAHDLSKFQLAEMIGYTIKWHDKEGKVREKFKQLGFTDEQIKQMWKSARSHHYFANSHHPQLQDGCSQTDLEEAICDMVAMGCEMAGKAIPTDFDQLAAYVLADDEFYIKRFSQEEQNYIKSKILATGEMVLDHNAHQLSLNVPKNMYMLYCGNNTGKGAVWTRMLNGFILKGRVMLTNRHGLGQLVSYKYLHMQNACGKTYTYEVSQLVIQAYTTNRTDDVGIIVLPRTFPPHTDFTNHLVKKDQLGGIRSTSASLLTYDFVPPGTVRSVRSQVLAEMKTENRYMTTNMDGTTTTHTCGTCYTYNAITQPGDCGAVLVATNKQVPNKILGFHVWGFMDNIGGAYIVTQEEVAGILEDMPGMAQCALISRENENGIDDRRLQDTNYMLMGTTEPVKTSRKTRLRRTPLDYTEPKTAPAMLGPRRGIDPHEIGVRKYSRDTPLLDQAVVDAARDSYAKKLLSGDRREHFRQYSRLTKEQATAGIPEEEFIAPIERSTSPGYPYCLEQRKKRGKQSWISEDYEISDDLANDIDERTDLLARGIGKKTIWVDNLKDERRPMEKVTKGKTRIFCGGPMDYTIVFRMFFLGFAAFVMHNRISNEVAVGINVYKEWRALEKHLRTKGNRIVAGDFSKFDSTLNPQILFAVLDVVNMWAGDEYSMEREILWQDIVFSCHISKTQVYQVAHGNPSGNPLTSILNSMYNSIASRVAYTNQTGKHPDEFDEDIVMISYGDDSVLGISLNVDMGQDDWTKAYATLGMEYTREDKTENDGTQYRKLEEVTFLKRGFKVLKHTYIVSAPLELNTVVEIPLWIKTDIGIEDETVNNLETAFTELSLHGKETYDHWTTIMYENARKKMTKLPLLPSWESMYETVTTIKPVMGLKACAESDEQQNLNTGGIRRIPMEGAIPTGQCLPSKI